MLNARFGPFGNLEYCKVIKDRNTSESKGIAYVKYYLASTAALAMETVNEQGVIGGIFFISPDRSN